MNKLVQQALQSLNNGDITQEQYITCLSSEIAKNRSNQFRIGK